MMNPLAPTPYVPLQSPTAAIPSYHIQGQPTSSTPQQAWPQVRGTVVSPTSQQAQPQVYEIDRSVSVIHTPPPLINSGTTASSSSAGTASNPTVKYVCCGHCRQWLLSPADAQYVHCPTCDCVNHCQVGTTYYTYIYMLYTHTSLYIDARESYAAVHQSDLCPGHVERRGAGYTGPGQQLREGHVHIVNALFITLEVILYLMCIVYVCSICVYTILGSLVTVCTINSPLVYTSSQYVYSVLLNNYTYTYAYQRLINIAIEYILNK